MLIRALVGIGLMMVIMNVSIKQQIWDSILKGASGPLVFKTFCGTSKDLINFSVTKYLPLTLISIISNMNVLVVYILAFIILKETVRKFDLIFTLFLLVGVIITVVGGDEESMETGADPLLPYWLLYILLFVNLFLSAGGTIAMRKMAKFSDNVVSWY